MTTLSQVNRPVSFREIAIAFGVSAPDLEAITIRRRIKPACVIEGLALYGPTQIQAIFDALNAEASLTPA